MLCMSLNLRKSLYSFDRKGGPLSLTICLGNPYLVNRLEETPIVAATSVLLIGPATSGHLEYASTRIR